MIMTSRQRWLSMLAGVVCLCCNVEGQRPSASRAVQLVLVRGLVLDTLGMPVPGASVKVRQGSAAPVISDSAGRYQVLAPRQRKLTMDVSRSGYPPLTIDLASGGVDTLTADLYLLGAVAPAAPAQNSASLGRRPSDLPDTGSSPLAASGASAPVVGAPVARAVRREPYAIRGVVTDTLGLPLLGAIVTVVSQQRTAVTDSAGQFAINGLVPGAVLLRVRRVGFQPRNVTTTVSTVDAVLIDVPLSGLGQALAKVTVRSDGAPSSLKLRGFYERKAQGFGQYLTRDQFVNRSVPRFTDLVNTFSGVVATQDRNGRRRIYGRGRCEMAVYLDGMHIIIPDNTSVDNFLNVDEVDAVEVYTGVGALPPEFSGRTNACGVIAAWTRSKAGR